MAYAPIPASIVGPFMAAGPKDLVTTGLGSSHVWVTVGQGVINEVYWPTVGEPQIRDLGFIVAGDGWWHEIKQVANYQIQGADPTVPLPAIIHSGPVEHPYKLTLEVVPDSERDVILVAYELSGADARVYALLASHLQRHPADNAANDYSGGRDNIAWVDGPSLFAQGAGRSLCLSADPAFSQTSVGYFGSSDLWQDFSQHNAMTWDFTNAGPGFVVLGAELAAASGTIALAFADDPATAGALTGQSLDAGITTARTILTRDWQEWSASSQLPPPAAGDPASLRDALCQSAVVLRVHQDQTHPGATVAGLSTPWGDTSNNPGGYHLVWPRDAVECGFALVLSGHSDDAQRLLDYLVDQQSPDGRWQQNFYPDGTPYWTGIQLDETALPVMLAAKLDDLGHPPSDATKAMITNAIGYLTRNGPLSLQDRWEEDPGGSPFTLGVIIAALVAGAKYLDAAPANYALALADNWNERLEEWTYVADSWLDTVFGLDGHYVRVGPDPQTGAARIANQPNQDFAVPSSGVLGLEFAYLARLGLRSPTSKAITDTAQLADIMLSRNVGTGVGYYRYNYDGYGEDYQGANWAGTGTGRLWPLLAGERGHLAVLAGEDGLSQLASMLNMRTPSGLLPEQVWDQPPLTPRNGIPSLPLFTGQRTLSATPLAWAHSELIKLAWTRATGIPVEQLSEVTARYAGGPPSPSTSYWRITVPLLALPADRNLVIEDTQPFTLHYGFGDPENWTNVSDADSSTLPFSMHGVGLPANALTGHNRLNFIRRYGSEWDPHGDQTIPLQQAPPRQLPRHSS